MYYFQLDKSSTWVNKKGFADNDFAFFTYIFQTSSRKLNIKQNFNTLVFSSNIFLVFLEDKLKAIIEELSYEELSSFQLTYFELFLVLTF